MYYFLNFLLVVWGIEFVIKIKCFSSEGEGGLLSSWQLVELAQGSERHTDSFLCLSHDISGIYRVLQFITEKRHHRNWSVASPNCSKIAHLANYVMLAVCVDNCLPLMYNLCQQRTGMPETDSYVSWSLSSNVDSWTLLLKVKQVIPTGPDTGMQTVRSSPLSLAWTWFYQLYSAYMQIVLQKCRSL